MNFRLSNLQGNWLRMLPLIALPALLLVVVIVGLWLVNQDRIERLEGRIHDLELQLLEPGEAVVVTVSPAGGAGEGCETPAFFGRSVVVRYQVGAQTRGVCAAVESTCVQSALVGRELPESCSRPEGLVPAEDTVSPGAP